MTIDVPSACVASAMYCACMSVGKPGIFFGIHVGGLQRLIAHHADGIRFHGGLHAGLCELLQDGGQVRGIASGDIEVAARERSGDDESSGLDTVGNDAMPGAVELARHPLRE